MVNNRSIIGSLSAIVIFTALMSTMISSVDAATSQNTEIIPLNSEIGIEKTILSLHASPDNTLPWGFVEGKIINHVSN